MIYVLFYYIIGYRKKVVLENLAKAFPEKTNAERIFIAKEFYNHFCDLIVESLKMFTISEHEVKRRMVCKSSDVPDMYYDQKKSILIAGGHYGNWELAALAIDGFMKHQGAAIYLLLSDPYFDNKMKESRGRYGLKMISTRAVKPYFEENKGNLTASIFLVDQSPKHPSTSYWTSFLKQETAVSFGIEKYAKELNYPVVYFHLKKLRRGFYEMSFEDVAPSPKETAYGEITEKVTAMAEADVLYEPAYWLWSHKRWKFTKPSEVKGPIEE